MTDERDLNKLFRPVMSILQFRLSMQHFNWKYSPVGSYDLNPNINFEDRHISLDFKGVVIYHY